MADSQPDTTAPAPPPAPWMTSTALSDDERNRATLSNIGELAMIIVGLATVARLPGDYHLKRAIMLTGFVAGVSNACAHLVVRTGRSLGALYVLKLPLAVVAGFLLLYFGPLSLAVAVLAVGIYFYGQSGSRVVAGATFALCCGGYLALVMAQNAGWVADSPCRCVKRPTDSSTRRDGARRFERWPTTQ